MRKFAKKPGHKATFRYFRENPREADAYGRIEDGDGNIIRAANQEKIANRAYANRIGNGDIESGDGWAYRGSGLLQTTGRGNYQSLQNAYKGASEGGSLDFVKNPELLAQPRHAVASAAHFWSYSKLHRLADAGPARKNVDAITQVINRGTGSYSERNEHFSAFWSANVFNTIHCGVANE